MSKILRDVARPAADVEKALPGAEAGQVEESQGARAPDVSLKAEPLQLGVVGSEDVTGHRFAFVEAAGRPAGRAGRAQPDELS